MSKSDERNLWSGFWQIADPKIWIASTIPMAVGGALAYAQSGSFNWYWFIIGLFAVYLLEIGKNAINEYVDYLSGVDRFVTPDKRTPFSGGKKTIIDGKLTLKENLVIGIVTISLGCLLGLYIVAAREFSVLWFGLAGVFFALFYSLPPFQFAYRGFGELAVGFTFGPLITIGTYLVQTGTISMLVVIASMPLGFIIANVLWINQFPDYEADLKGGKMNGVVRLGKKKGVSVYALLFGLAYLFLLILAVFSKSILWLLPFISLPPAVKAVKVAREHYDNIPLLIEANAKTIQVYQLTGVTMIAAALLTLLF
ncbi:MAG: 1,4-dihydroxy-2-naphthoate octaprenyltransferase [Bacillota bacterium]|nr:1,4-dihydroxy-2-naphthoate octaprenyltransferase [Bacillota bacterium]